MTFALKPCRSQSFPWVRLHFSAEPVSGWPCPLALDGWLWTTPVPISGIDHWDGALARLRQCFMDFGVSGAKYFIWLLGNPEIWPVFCNHYNEEKVDVHWQAEMTSLHRLRRQQVLHHTYTCYGGQQREANWRRRTCIPLDSQGELQTTH